MSTRDITVDLPRSAVRSSGQESMLSYLEGTQQGGMTLVDGVWRHTGRLYKPDSRDMGYVMDETALRGITRAQPATRARPWKIGPRLDQVGDTCVINTYFAFEFAAPVYNRHGVLTPADERKYYRLSQQNDDIPGENYAGTTARGILKVMKDEGRIVGYLWITDADTMQEYLKTRGTVMQGTDWPQSFFNTNKHGYVEVEDQTRLSTLGHETLVRWYHGPKHRRYPDTYECVNSWGTSYGIDGRFFMKADVAHWLWFQCNGDLASPIEAARVRKGAQLF